jgi:hypothetical protein
VNPRAIVQPLLKLGESVRDAVRRALAERTPEERIQVHGKAASDVIYRIDLDAENVILGFLREEAQNLGGIVLVAEGMGEGTVNAYPKGTDPLKAAWKIMMDPIDGTRALMVGKRGAFFVAGAAPHHGTGGNLSDIEAAVMVEIPTDRSNLSDVLWAVKGGGTQGYTRDLKDGSSHPLTPTPSKEPTIHGGFAQVSRFFHPGKDVLAALEEELVRELYPKAQDGEIVAFEDQYVCSAGQLYELVMGRDRFTADLRHSLYTKFRREGRRTGHECHAYDLSAHLVALEAGIVLEDGRGNPLDAPLDTAANLDWAGYANRGIRDQVSPVLARLVKKHLT